MMKRLILIDCQVIIFYHLFCLFLGNTVKVKERAGQVLAILTPQTTKNPPLLPLEAGVVPANGKQPSTDLVLWNHLNPSDLDFKMH